MTTQELKDYINKVLGNNIRCLLPSYWWKRLLGLLADRVEEVDVKVDALPKGVTIVSSEEELDALELPNGSVASVACEVTGRAHFSDCYQGTMADANAIMLALQNGTIDQFDFSKYNLVKDLVVTLETFESTNAYDCPMLFGKFGQIILMTSATTRGAMIQFVSGAEKEEYSFLTSSDNAINESEVERFNAFLEENDCYYLATFAVGSSSTLIDPKILDAVYSIPTTYPEANTYVKANSWEKLYKEGDNTQYIVSTLTDLNNLDVAKGSIASVLYGGEKSFKDCYQGTIDDLDVSNIDTTISELDKYDVVKYVNVKFAPSEFPAEAAERGVFILNANKIGVLLGIGLDCLAVAMDLNSNTTTNEFIFYTSSDTAINESEVARFNAYLAEGGFHYITTVDCDFVDSFFTLASLESVAYIKSDSWERLAKESDIPESSAGFEIREFRIGDSLTDEDKAWNLETMELVNQNKCTVVYTITETLGNLPLGSVIPLTFSFRNGFIFILCIGIYTATWEITISDDGSASLTTTQVTTDTSLSTVSELPVQNKVITAALNEKQATLVSGTNIKTINGTSILGSGNIVIEGGGSDITVDSALSTTSTNPVQNKVIKVELDNKVDVVSGKQLSTEDFTTALKTKLEGLSNYDDTEISNALTSLETQINTLVSGDASSAIESFNEIIAFLNGIEDSESLDSIVASIEQQIASKQDVIEDLATIREGAALGMTALQAHQDISHLATKDEVIENEEVTAAALNDLDARVSAIADNVSGSAATKEELEAAVDTLEAADTANSEAITAVDGKVDTLETTVVENYATKAELQNEVDTLNGTITTLQNEVITNEEVTAASLNEINDRVNQLSENVQGEAATKTELQDAVTSLTNTILENEEVSASAFNDINDRVSSCATLSDLDAKQDILVSGTNIKTINNQSLLGSGNINIEGGEGGGVAELMTETTYADLVALRDAGNLVAGMKYRITDYETKTSKGGSQSAGHLFDIIVTALDGSTLDEKASAIQSERDTDGYFANSKLEAWEVWYCLDNDTDRFDWAVKAGTILTVDMSEMEAGSVQAVPNGTFEYEGTTYYRWDATIMGIAIYILTANASPTVGESAMIYMLEYSSVIGNAPVVSLTESTDNGFGVIYRLIDEKGNDVSYDFKNMQFIRKITDGTLDLENGADTWCYTFSDFSTGVLLDTSESLSQIAYNRFGLFCWDNVFIGNNSYSNTFGDKCYSNTFGTNCYSNTFGNQCVFNIFDDYCSDNTFGNQCSSNAFGEGCRDNTFGNQCGYNTFGNQCSSNIFGNYCYSNTFGNQCVSNPFGTGCESNAFGNECSDNTFDDYCRNNTFGNSCRSNTFDDYCRYITFGTDCSYNAFGCQCSNNTFGDACDSNTFGNLCQYNTFATASDGSTIAALCKYNTLGHSCSYNIIWNASGNIENIEIKSRIRGTDESAKQAIEIPVADAAYVQTVAKNSSGVIKIYCEADLIQ